jgi:thiol:disulfide interchange protein DsbD
MKKTALFRQLRTSAGFALAWAVVSPALFAAPVRTDHVEAELVAERTSLVPGAPSTVALRLKIENGWHTYWKNPGDSGLATTLAWKAPAGYRVGDIEWPAPRALPVGPLVNHGYEGDVLHLVAVTPPIDAKPGTEATLTARADWLVCKETCIPDGADLALTLPIAATAPSDPTWGPRIAEARESLPRPLAGWRIDARGDGARIAMTLAPPPGAVAPDALHFFPDAEARIEPSGAQTLERADSGAYVLTLPVSSQYKGEFKRVTGVLTAANGLSSGPGTVKAASIDVPLVGAVVAGPKPKQDAIPALNVDAGVARAAATRMTLVAALALAFCGGLVLNLMPCVFPVLSMKALALAAPGHHDTSRMRASGLAFGAGVVATFVALALVLLVLRGAGEQIGWGFQLQSPAVVTALAVLFFVLALNLSGVFEFGAPWTGTGPALGHPHADAFLSGVLAVVIASPCTAPFMGAALGYALTEPAAVTLAVFVALGVGMAVPFALLSWFPGWRRALPRPGAWMLRLKQLLAFPLYATVAWLAWVLGAQVDNDAVMRLLVTLVVVAFALWAWRAYRGGGSGAFGAAALAALLGAALVAWPLLRNDSAAGATTTARRAATDTAWQPWSPERVADLTRRGTPVFVDFTAAWCVTCQVNKRLVLNDSTVRDAFARRRVELVRADWTRRDPAITRALAALGRNGVPVYVLYRPGREPLLLPEVLSKGLVVDALAAI